MSDVKRYRVEDYPYDMIEDSEGDYVDFEDYESIKRERDEWKAKAERVCEWEYLPHDGDFVALCNKMQGVDKHGDYCSFCGGRIQRKDSTNDK